MTSTFADAGKSYSQVSGLMMQAEHRSETILRPSGAIHTEAKAAAQEAYGTALRKDAWDDVVRAVAMVFSKYRHLAEALDNVEEAK